MLINCLLIVYDAYRVNKLIEAKLGLGHLSEHGKKTFTILSLTFMTIRVLDFRVTKKRWRWCLLAKKPCFFFFEGSSTCLYILFLQHGQKDFCGQTNF
jgi:hypothetical protein